MTRKNTTKGRNKFLKGVAIASLLCILFVLVFAGTIASSFAVQENLIQTGQIDANVANAGSYTHANYGTPTQGVSEGNALDTKYNVWTKIHINRGWIWGDPPDSTDTCSFEIKGSLLTLVGYGVVCFKLSYKVTNEYSDYPTVFEVYNTSKSSANFLASLNGNRTTGDYESDSYVDMPNTSVLYFYSKVIGYTGDAFESQNIGITFYGKSYTITINNQGATTPGSSSLGVSGGGAVSNITSATKTGYTLQGYYTEQNGAGTKIFNANGSPNKGTTYIDSSGKWIKNASPTVYAYWVKNTGTINYDASGGSGETSSTSITYGESFNLAGAGTMTKTVAGETYTLAGWSKTQNSPTADYKLGKSFDSTETDSHFSLASRTGSGAVITLYAVWTLGDFGIGDGKSKTDGTWGTSSNPFLIKNVTHLNNLASIVNGGTPFDSVNGYGQLEGLSGNTAANSKTYSGCYFQVVLANSNPLDATSLSTPIGYSSTYYFAGTFDGGNYTITVSLTQN